MSARDDDGASAVEYGLIVFAVAALVAIAVFGLGKVVRDSYVDSCTTIKSNTSSATSCT